MSTVTSPKMLEQMRESHEARMKGVRERKGKITVWDCPGCKKANEKEVPKKNQVGSKGYWDSATVCLSCGQVSFVQVWPSAKIVVHEMN